MDWQTELLFAARALGATILGAFIGWERERDGHEAGIRTFAVVSMGACVFTLVSVHLSDQADRSRIAAQIVSGIGFLGAGVIIRDKGRVRGLTTAGTLWSSASVGMAVGGGMYLLAVLATLIIFALLAVPHVPGYSKVVGSDDDETADPDFSP